jgi:hypothetical protein
MYRCIYVYMYICIYLYIYISIYIYIYMYIYIYIYMYMYITWYKYNHVFFRVSIPSSWALNPGEIPGHPSRSGFPGAIWSGFGPWTRLGPERTLGVVLIQKGGWVDAYGKCSYPSKSPKHFFLAVALQQPLRLTIIFWTEYFKPTRIDLSLRGSKPLNDERLTVFSFHHQKWRRRKGFLNQTWWSQLLACTDWFSGVRDDKNSEWTGHPSFDPRGVNTNKWAMHKVAKNRSGVERLNRVAATNRFMYRNLRFLSGKRQDFAKWSIHWWTLSQLE